MQGGEGGFLVEFVVEFAMVWLFYYCFFLGALFWV